MINSPSAFEFCDCGNVNYNSSNGVPNQTLNTHDPQKKALYMKCTNMYTEIGEFREAMNYAQQYIKCAPKDYKGYKMLGLLHEKTGSVKEALKAYRR